MGAVMSAVRKIKTVSKSKPTIEGAGVHLKRAFGYYQAPRFDPFLLLDDFRSNDPEKYLPGFPWHPHRGIETITYVIQGEVEHGDSMGNRGDITPGDVQWMSAGSDIIHQEMPKGDRSGRMGGFQLWANLPASQKMMDPRYRDVKREQIPEVSLEGGAKVKIICGNESLIVYEDGDHVSISAVDEPLRFLLVSGRPIGEPIAWYGPIVMNTQEELRTAFDEFRKGTFIKQPA